MRDQDALGQFLHKTVERMIREGYLRRAESAAVQRPDRRAAAGPEPARRCSFELTEKASDFLGYKTLRDLLGSLGKSSFGRHDTRDLATGVEASGPTKVYEFGDTLNLDVSGTLLSAIAREGLQACR